MLIINGLRLLTFVRDTKVLTDIPFIFTGEFKDPDMPIDTAELGFQCPLKKPFVEKDMVTAIEQCCYES